MFLLKVLWPKKHFSSSGWHNFHFPVVLGRLDKYPAMLACIHTLSGFDNTDFSLLLDQVYFYYPG